MGRTVATVIAVLCALVIVPSVAQAKPPRVAFLELDGDDNGDVHDVITQALGTELTFISAKEVHRAVDKIGADGELSLKDLKKLSSDLEADAVIQGRVESPKGENHVLHVKLFSHGKKLKVFKIEFASAKNAKLKVAIHDKIVEKLGGPAPDGDDDAPKKGDKDKGDKDDKDAKADKKKGKKPADDDNADDDAPKKGDKTAKADKKKGKKPADDDSADDDAPKKGDKADKADKDAKADKKKGKKPADDDSGDDDKDAKADKKKKKKLTDDDDKDAKADKTDDKVAKKKTGDDDSGDDDHPKKKKGGDDDASPHHKKVAAGGDDDAGGGGDVSARVDLGEDTGIAHPANRDAARIDVGMSLIARHLTYNASPTAVDMPEPYKNAPNAGAIVTGEVFPLAFSNRNGPAAGLGIAGEFNDTVGLKLRPAAGSSSLLPVTQHDYGIGIVYRYVIGPKVTSPSVQLGIGYGSREFAAQRSKLMPGDTDNLPDVDYKFFYPALDVRIPFARPVALVFGVKTWLARSAGPIQDPAQYGQTTVTAIDGYIGLDVTFMKRFALRLAGQYTQVGMAFKGNGALTNGGTGDPTMKDVGGATDKYYGGFLSLGVIY